MDEPEIICVPIDFPEQLIRQMVYGTRPAGRPVTTITREMLRTNWLAGAEARRRAVELADGGGLMAPLPTWCRGDEEDAIDDEPG
ncbi:MAG: hypothetical protein GY768_33255 [Planctomycetaceae bacterium]|nr:hypothetical protein [Planctomycetaceae bacterium]